MPKSGVRLSAGRSGMTEEMQAMCFMAGQIRFSDGDKLLVTDNPEEDGDQLLMAKLDLYPETAEIKKVVVCVRKAEKLSINLFFISYLTIIFNS